MNRKSIIIVFALVIIVLAAISISAANVQNNVQIKKNNSNGLYCNFTDDNNDGICDNCNNTNPKCDGTKQHIRNHTQTKLTNKSNQQSSNLGVCNPQTGNQYGKQVSTSGSSNGGYGHSASYDNSGYHYGQSDSSSSSGSGNQYGKSVSSSSGHHYGQSGNGQHSQQKLQIMDC